MALSKEVLENLLEATAELLVKRIQSGNATPADVSNALRMLKDNDISILIDDSDALKELNEKLARRRIKPVTLDDAKEYTKEMAYQ